MGNWERIPDRGHKNADILRKDHADVFRKITEISMSVTGGLGARTTNEAAQAGP